MISLGSERKPLEKQMRTTSRVRSKLALLKLDGDEVSDVSSRLIDGQVNIDTSSETSRQLSATFDDPSHSLSLDSDSPADGALYVDRMMQATYGFYVDELAKWVDVPIFTGPIVNMQRTGAQVQVSCLGKEHLAMSHAWRPLTLKKGMNVGAAIKTILRERAGEDSFSFGTVKNRLPSSVSLGRMSQPWVVAQQLAASIGRQLYYDGAGVCRLRKRSTGSVFTFDGDVVTSEVAVTYDLSTIINTVWVKGHKPENRDKQQITAAVSAPSSHALSPQKLGRNGDPRHIVEVIERGSVRSRKEARELARRTLSSRLSAGLDISFESLPIVHLDPLDVVRVDTDDASLSFPLQKASLPLLHSGVMSVGVVKRVTPRRERIR